MLLSSIFNQMHSLQKLQHKLLAKKCKRPKFFTQDADGIIIQDQSKDTIESRDSVPDLAGKVFQNQHNNWLQLSGHSGALKLVTPGRLWKRLPDPQLQEWIAYRHLMADTCMCDAVPRFHRLLRCAGEYYIEIDDLLHSFVNPSMIDIKLGTRTFLEKEVHNSKLRQDLYDKMLIICADELSSFEHQIKAVTKARYLSFRDRQSTTAQLGFRVEALKVAKLEPIRELRRIRSRADVAHVLSLFLRHAQVCDSVLAKLHDLRARVESSDFFRLHEVIGVSVMLIYDSSHCGVYLIDFSKSSPLPPGVTVTHRDVWCVGNCEDGCLTGLDNLIQVIEEIQNGFLASGKSL